MSRYDIGPMPRQLDTELTVRLQSVETATIGHVRLHGFLDPDIRAVINDRRIAGPAVTVRIPGADSTLLHHALGHVREGDVLLIDRCGDDFHACWGGSLTVAGVSRGLAGVIIDGRATDLGEIRRAGLPLWCRGPSPVTTRLLDWGGVMNRPISVGGVVIKPGDAIVADENGIVVLDPDEADAWATWAIAEQDDEIPFNNSLLRGDRLGDLTGATEMVENAVCRQAERET